MKLSGWGRHPIVGAEVFNPSSVQDVFERVSGEGGRSLIARGMGRSYGDSALAEQVLDTTRIDHLLRFDSIKGLLTCSAGVTLSDILSVFVPRGWFLPVTPGTKYVTVGGAVASDVHGKNHHLHGTFCDHISALKIMIANGDVIECSRDQHPDLFRATCGGMGLTGIILTVSIKMKAIQSSNICETIIKSTNIETLLELFDEHHESTYSVAWIDCLSTGRFLGRSLLMLGEHIKQGGLVAGKAAKLSVPAEMPNFLLNSFSIQVFNALYYHRVIENMLRRIIHYEPFFYPLDGVRHWNRMYGKKGFIQYQFVLPKDAGLSGMKNILGRIAASKRASFLAVLKAFGKSNENYLSFPIDGYTLALDFKLEKGLFELLEELDKIVVDYGGRLYLAKDVRMTEEVFKQGYLKWCDFREVREKYGADQIFHSLQSRRLGL